MTPRSAKILVPGEGTWLWWLGHPVRYLSLGSDTADTYAMSWGTVPVGSGPPPHRHVFGEGFYVVRGELTFTAGNRTEALGPGGFVHLAPNVAHYLRNTVEVEAEVIVVAAPAGFDSFQMEAGTPIASPNVRLGPPTSADYERLTAAAIRHGIELNPPAETFATAPRLTVRRAGEGRQLYVVGDLYTFLAEGEDTDGTYAFWEAIVPPGGGPPPHVHSREEEGFFVLEGSISFFAAGQRVVATPGTFLNLPRGVPHSFKNESDQPGRMLILVAPAGLEKMFQQTGIPVTDRTQPPPPVTHEEIERLLRIAPTYGVEILVPRH